jgi:hypothetical protein
MLKMSAQHGMRRPDPPPTSSQQASKELAMHIGEDQQEFEILPEEEQPVVVPEHEPQRQPEDTPA